MTLIKSILLIVAFITLFIKIHADLQLKMCSDIDREPNTCKLRYERNNKTHFEFNTFYAKHTKILRIYNSTLPKLGRYGLCADNYPHNTINEVEEIYLPDVQLEEMTSDAFQNCNRLKILILRNNKIETLKEVFSHNRELEKLDLTSNLIKDAA